MNMNRMTNSFIKAYTQTTNLCFTCSDDFKHMVFNMFLFSY